MKLRFNLKMAVVVVALATMTSSCHIYKSFEMPKEGVSGEISKLQSEQVDSTALGNLTWEKVFTDATLQSLIKEALANNVDLKNAKLNIDAAQAQLLGAKLSYLPSLALTPNGAGSQNGITNTMTWTYQLPLAASWEIDIFGRILNTKRQAKANLLQSEAYQQAVRSQLISAVANTYYSLVILEQQRQIYVETASKWKESVEVMKQMKEAGRYTEVAVVQSIANYNNVLASIPEIELSLHKMNNVMSLLLNVAPQTWAVNVDAKPLVVDQALNGIPMNYVAWRPDVASAEQALAKAYYSTNIARSAFYPNLVISAQGGFTNLLGGMITNPGKWFIDLAGQLTAPLFARGQNIQNLKVAKAQQEQAMNNFEYTVLNASAEVSNAIVTLNKKVTEQQFLEVQVDNLNKAVTYNEDLQTLGTTTYLEVLTAQQSLLSSQIQMLTNELSISQASINLYQSLGGGR